MRAHSCHCSLAPWEQTRHQFAKTLQLTISPRNRGHGHLMIAAATVIVYSNILCAGLVKRFQCLSPEKNALKAAIYQRLAAYYDPLHRCE